LIVREVETQDGTKQGRCRGGRSGAASPGQVLSTQYSVPGIGWRVL